MLTTRLVHPCPPLRFAPPLPTGGGWRDSAARAAYESNFSTQKDRLKEQGWFAEADGGEAWRIHVRASDYDGKPYAEVIQRLRSEIEPIIVGHRDSIQVEFTGGFPLIDAAQGELLDDLTKSFLLAFVVLAPCDDVFDG